MTLDKALFYLFILEIEKKNLSNIKLNDLSISIFGTIVQPISKDILKAEVIRIIKEKKDFLKSVYEIKLDRDVSEKINPSLIGKILIFEIENLEHSFIINSISEKSTNINQLNNKILITK
ncbi:hypothetical protein [Mucilaginibacter sp.]|uniref:hypothetical protein n=1 Tax=Mucilaginibacter sp. TaxID=1882438 RepID=UPI003B00B7E4